MKHINADISILNNIDFLKYNGSKFDKILLDVPCSSTGTIAKNPDVKIRRKSNDFNYYNKLQLLLLNKAKSLLKDKGSLVYSTCSICSKENWFIINSFIKNNSSFTIKSAKKFIGNYYTDNDGALNISPNKYKLDGMFAVRLQYK